MLFNLHQGIMVLIHGFVNGGSYVGFISLVSVDGLLAGHG